MSALQQNQPEALRLPAGGSTRAPLELVPARRERVGRTPFAILVASILAVGMVGLLLLNTHLQNQAFEANRLKRHAAELAYVQGELEQSVITASSARELTRRATALGLRPNHGIAYVDLNTGKVDGIPQQQEGTWMPEALSLSAEEIRQNNQNEAINAADHRRAAEEKAAADARQRLLDARAKAEADARAKAEADARAKADAAARAAQPNPPAQNANRAPVPNGPNQPNSRGPQKPTQKPVDPNGAR